MRTRAESVRLNYRHMSRGTGLLLLVNLNNRMKRRSAQWNTNPSQSLRSLCMSSSALYPLSILWSALSSDQYRKFQNGNRKLSQKN